MIRDIDIEQALALDNPRFVDLRAPVEFQEATIPGAVNIPLFDDVQRSEIGAIYRHQGPELARKRGLEFAAPRLSELVKACEEQARQGSLVIFCWRGGERSRAMASILNLMHVEGFRLVGGYKAYRRYVVKRLEELPTGKVFVLHGLTGTGKTDIIRELKNLGVPAIDLEGLANHRGSVFGSIGLGEQPRQKQFESVLLHELEKAESIGYVVVECESRKIGRLFLPEKLYMRMKTGIHVLVYDTINGRISRLSKAYGIENELKNCDELIKALQGLTPYMGKEKINNLIYMMTNGLYESVIRTMLTDYYDPLYGYSSGPDDAFDICLDGSDSRKAAEILADILNKTVKEGSRVGYSGR